MSEFFMLFFGFKLGSRGDGLLYKYPADIANKKSLAVLAVGGSFLDENKLKDVVTNRVGGVALGALFPVVRRILLPFVIKHVLVRSFGLGFLGLCFGSA